jgi:nucleoside-diphosphate-sugar epimerase
MKQTILITGGAGYIGSVVTRAMLNSGYQVICVDKLAFGGASLLGLWHHPDFKFHRCDITDFDAFEMILRDEKPDAVIHLAAIVGDPACSREPELAKKINWEASKWLVDACRRLGIEKFLFASTCSNYGKMGDNSTFVTEDSALSPVSLYAELKVKLEQYLLDEIPQDDNFTPTALRFATVYGVSPRMRFDLTVNEFTKELFLGKELLVFGEQFWRPYCHVKDFANAFQAVLNAPREKVAYDVFNVGSTDENYTKQMVIDEIKKFIPTAVIKYVKKTEDPRDYRVNFDKIKSLLGFEITMRVPDGIKEIEQILSEGIICETEDQMYYNIPHKCNVTV